MEKHIALLFLSIFQTDQEEIIDDKTNKKIKIHKLKSQNDYYGKDGFAVQGRHTNEPAVYYLLEKYQQLDKLFIFASDKVRSKLKYVDDHNIEHNQKSHLQFFMDTIAAKYEFMKGKKLPEDIFAVVDYDEPVIADKEDYKNWSYDSNNADFASILEMATKVKTYCNQVKHAEGEDTEIHLHVDMTGGFRHANMLMLAVIDLLKYSGLHVDDVIYTNFDYTNHVGKIEEVTNIHNIFQLVAGAEEFSNYGSVKTLDKYFKDVKKSRKLEKLLNSMRNFSDVLKLCRTGMLEIVVKRLKKNIENYKGKSTSEIQNGSREGMRSSEKMVTEEEKIFKELLDTIEKKYKVFFKKDEINYVNIVDWCYENDFIQQALTFFVELIPSYVVKNRILYPSVEVEQVEKFDTNNKVESKKIVNKENLSAWQQKLCNLEVEEVIETDNQKPWMMDLLRCYVPYEMNISEKKGDKKKKPFDIFKNLLSRYIEQKNNKNLKKIEFFLKYYAHDYSNLIHNNYDFYQLIIENNQNVCKQLLKLDERNFRKTIGLEEIDYESTKNDAIYMISAKKRNKVIRRMLEKGLLCTKFPNDDYSGVLELTYQYNKIRKIRNIVNHASAEDEISNEKIREELKEALDVFKNFDRKSNN